MNQLVIVSLTLITLNPLKMSTMESSIMEQQLNKSIHEDVFGSYHETPRTIAIAVDNSGF